MLWHASRIDWRRPSLLPYNAAHAISAQMHPLLKLVHAKIDQHVADSLAGIDEPVTCARGCNHCCHGMLTTVFFPEMLAIVEERLSCAQGREALHATVPYLFSNTRELADKRMTTKEWKRREYKCWLLADDGDCSVYAIHCPNVRDALGKYDKDISATLVAAKRACEDLRAVEGYLSQCAIEQEVRVPLSDGGLLIWTEKLDGKGWQLWVICGEYHNRAADAFIGLRLRAHSALPGLLGEIAEAINRPVADAPFPDAAGNK